VVCSANADASGASGSAATIPDALYNTAQAARLAGCSPAQLRHWARTGLVVPSADGSYAFRDLVALRVVRSLLNAGLPSARVRSALRELHAHGEPELASLRLVTDGRTVWACYDDGQILDALKHGQLALFVAVDRVTADVEAEVRTFEAERAAFVDELMRDPTARGGHAAESADA
jgi:DNA-binding transcriptional MerR regulator